MGVPFEVTGDMVEQARRALSGRELCPSCLGRLFGKIGSGHTNAERGRKILETLTMQPPSGKCWLCEGVMSEIPKFADLALSELAKWEHSSFLIGSKVDSGILTREEDLWVESGVQHPESVKSELNREIGKLVEKVGGKPTDFSIPDIVTVIDTRYDFAMLQVSSLYIYGRYKKLVRNIPQTRWLCRVCMGKGCAHCGGKGKMYETSVEEYAALDLMRETGATDHAFHGMGREDIDARMLGNGRPFILELMNPRKRNVPLDVIERQTNERCAGKIEVMSLVRVGPGEVERLKSAAFPKTYVVGVRLPEWDGGRENLKKGIDIFRGAQISQRTPERVAHRRADLVRKRIIMEFGLQGWDEVARTAEFKIKAESGTYIKELITGDGGRTEPSLSAILGTKCEVLELDVVRINDSE